MKATILRLSRVLLFASLAVTLPATSQDRSNRPGGSDQGNGPLNGGRPPGQGNSGGPQTQPARPSPGGGSGGDRPGSPGGGNNGGGRPNPGPPSGPKPGPSRLPSGPRPTPPRPAPLRPNPGPRPPASRPPQWGRPPQSRPSYQFRPTDRDYFRRYYLSRLGYINRARRPIFTVGGFFPFADITYLSPLPMALYGRIPPPPPGYQMGYFDGYVVVYDPITYFIADVIDLLQ
jgi:hypothetical protein